jgi:DNA replicative helicase MCM subunit Mcm2 (Cdc46/Mcm family)
MGAGMPRMEVGVTADEEEANVATAVYVKYNRLLHGVKRTRHSKRDKLTTKFLKKYIHYAKSRHAPILTEEVCNLIFTFLYFLNDLLKLVNMIRDLD